MFGKTTVVINSAKVVQDLLEARSAIYSDRPLNIMGGVLAQRKDIVFSISSQHPRFKMYRRLMNGGLSPKVALDYRSIQLEELHRFMRAIERTPEKFKQEVKRCVRGLFQVPEGNLRNPLPGTHVL
jgi:cytochrome P450